MQPTVSPRSEKLVYSSLFISLNIWRRDLLHPKSPAVELLPSSQAQWDAQYSPDGKRIALQSLRSGVLGVWISNEDGSDLVQISNPHLTSGSPQWSPDGNKIVFDSLVRNRWEIYVADVAERKPRKLVTNISNVIKPHWSRDGKWIYFHVRTNLAERESIVVPPPAETPFHSPKILMERSAGVFRWEDGIFCKSRREFDAEASSSAGAARRGISSGWIASAEQLQPLEPFPRRRLFCSCRGTQISSDTLISPPGRYAQFLKSTRISAGTVTLSRWPLDPLFTNWRCERRHHARRSLSVASREHQRGQYPSSRSAIALLKFQG